MREKIGVYVCHCGGNISDTIDVERVRETVEKYEGVSLAKTMLLACADSSQKEIVTDIGENHLDAIVVASCSPKLHLNPFRATAERANLNPFNYVQVNIREQGSWAHSDTPKEATEKAIRLVEAGIARVRHSRPLIPVEISAVNTAAIIGAGVSGLRAAIELADMGTEVFLIERDHFVGGRVAQWGALAPTDQDGGAIVADLFSEAKRRPNLTLLTGADLESVSGCVGSYQLSVRIRPRYVKPGIPGDALAQAIQRCPVEVKNEFDFGMALRKAIYLPYAAAVPSTPAIDMASCTRCGACVEVCKEHIDLDQPDETMTIDAGAILLNTGFDPYEPAEGEYGYGQHDRVITLQELKRLMEKSGEKLTCAGRSIEHIAFIYCVGSRQKQGDNHHCSRYCCTAAIHSALQLKQKFADIHTFHFYRDIRTYGKQERLYEASGRQGDIYLKFSEDDPPRVETDGDDLRVHVHDLLTDGEEITVEPDLVVLVTGMVPSRQESLTQILKVPVGRDRFFNEIHPKLRPVETVIDGVFISGSCQGPKNAAEAVHSALSAASKAHAKISKGKIELDPLLATVDAAACEWCGKCLDICTYDAIQQVDTDGKQVALIIQAKCKGCGACAPVCPQDAIDIIGYSNPEIDAMIDALAEEVV